MGAAVDILEYKITGNTSKYDAAINRSHKKTTAFDGAVVKAGGAMSRMIPIAAALAGTAALGGVVAVMADGVRSMAEWERRTLRTEALIKATGDAAGLTAAELSDFANQLDLATLGNRDNITDAINAMQTFKSVSGDVFKDSIRLSMDLSEVLGVDVSSQAVQLGKALEEPTIGLSALRRVGVSFTESQKEMIKSLDESGRKVEAQRLVLKALEEQVGGAAAGAAGGTAGKFDTASFRVREFKEALAQLEPVVTSVNFLLDGFNSTMESINRALGADPLVQVNRKIEDLQQKILMSSGGGVFDFANKRIERLNSELADLMMERAEIIAHGSIIKPTEDVKDPPDPQDEIDAFHRQMDLELERYRIKEEFELKYYAAKDARDAERRQAEIEAAQAEMDLDYQRYQIKEQHEQTALAASKKVIDDEKKMREMSVKTAVDRSKWGLQMLGKHSKVAQAAYKALAIGEAIISGKKAAIHAWEQGQKIGGPPMAAAFAAGSIAWTAAQIAEIGGGGGGSVPSTPAVEPPRETLPDIDPAVSEEKRGNLHIHFDGPVLGDEAAIADFLVDKINDAADRDVYVEFARETIQ